MTIPTWLRKLRCSTSLRLSRSVRESQSRQLRSLAEFEHLYQRHSRELYSFCFETVGDRAEAEKLVQVAFLHLFCQAEAFRAGVNPKILLFRSILSALRTHTKARKEESFPEASGANQASYRGAIGQQTLRNAIAELPPDLRVVFVLRNVLGYAPGEIAEILESSPRTSRWQAHQAGLRVRETLLRGGWKSCRREEEVRPRALEQFCEPDPVPGFRGDESSSVGHALNPGPRSSGAEAPRGLLDYANSGTAKRPSLGKGPSQK